MQREPDSSREDWVALDRAHVWHPYTQMATAPPPLAVARAAGVWLETADGRRVLDGISSWWVNLHGHSHPRLVRALTEQLGKLQQVVFAGASHEPAARLAAALVERTPPGLGHVFYSDDGSTSVEVGMKLAAQYHCHSGSPERTLFIGFDGAYHGDTFGTMATGGSSVFHGTFAPFLFEVRHARAPHEDANLESLAHILSEEAPRVAAVLVEPIVQGAAGMRISTAETLRRLRALCDQYDVLLIADEVFTGFGRTGRLFACEHGPIAPDILCLSKGITGGCLPLAATLSTDRIYEAFLSEDRGRTFFHGHSYTANALACAVACESLAILEDEHVLERIAQIEALFAEHLEALAQHALVRSTRGIGALAVLELEPEETAGYLDESGPRLHRALLERGIFLRPLGNVLYLLPPYAISDDEIAQCFDSIESVLDEELAQRSRR